MDKTNDIRKGRHCVYDLHAHLVFVTKYRHDVFTDEHLKALERIFSDVCASFDCRLEEFNGETDHVHLLISFPPTVELSRLVNSLKGVSSRYMRGGMGDVARMIVHDRLHPDMPVLAGRRLDELIDAHAYDALIATGMGDMLTVAQWTSIARHGDPAACRILDGMRRGMDDAFACRRLRGMCTPA